MTSSDNNSLAGLSVKNIEVVNITNSDFLGAGQGELAAATATASAAATAYSAAQANESSIVTSLTAQAILGDAVSGDEYTLMALETATDLASIQEYVAAATALLAETTIADADGATQFELETLLDRTSTEFDTEYPDAIFSRAQFNQVILQAQLGLDGIPIANDDLTDADSDNHTFALSDAISDVRTGYFYAGAAVVTGAIGEANYAGIGNAAVSILVSMVV